MTTIVVHYKELALKGRNRPWFIQLLVRNLKTALAGLPIRSVRSLMGRIEIELANHEYANPGSANPESRLPNPVWNEARDRVRRVFGIANFSYANRGPHDFDELAAAVLRDLGDREASSFRVRATRADKRPAVYVAAGRARSWRAHQGSEGVACRPRSAGSDHPSRDAARSRLLLFRQGTRRRWHAHGNGRPRVLFAVGGIDSPVAAYRMMRRGCSVELIHFHSYPILSRASQEKVRQIATLLTAHQLRSRLVLVAFGEIQQQVVVAVPPELRVVVYRRLMLRIAERFARKWHARALVTGEAIGQVASQTLENMTTIASATSLEILRPLVGMDKDEICARPRRSARTPFRSFRIRIAARCSRRAIRRRARACRSSSRSNKPCPSTRWSNRPWPGRWSRTSRRRRPNCGARIGFSSTRSAC
jgi:thiamine biosynthesis protein ThiI